MIPTCYTMCQMQFVEIKLLYDKQICGLIVQPRHCSQQSRLRFYDNLLYWLMIIVCLQTVLSVSTCADGRLFTQKLGLGVPAQEKKVTCHSIYVWILMHFSNLATCNLKEGIVSKAYLYNQSIFNLE